MNILHLMPYVPVPLHFGGAIRIYHMLQSLAFSHKVEVVAFGTVQDRIALQKNIGHLVSGIHVVPWPWVNKVRRLAQLYSLASRQSFFSLSTKSAEMQRMVNEVLDRRAIDVAQTEFYFMGQYVTGCNALKVLDAHNVEYDNFHRMAVNTRSRLRQFHYHQESRKGRAEELAVYTRHDLIMCTSERDRAVLDSDLPHTRKLVVPNGVDMQHFVPGTQNPEPHSMVFTGMMGYHPNYDGILHFLDEIFPLILRVVPDAKIYIVGGQPPRALRARAAKNIVITGYVSDIRPYVWRSSVYVVPLRMGGGTRLKILEAMAMRIPIVTTRIGCEGINLVDGESALITDQPEDFTRSVVQLMRDRELSYRLTEASYQLAETYYDWSVIRQQVNELYGSMIFHWTHPKPVRHQAYAV